MAYQDPYHDTTRLAQPVYGYSDNPSESKLSTVSGANPYDDSSEKGIVPSNNYHTATSNLESGNYVLNSGPAGGATSQRRFKGQAAREDRPTSQWTVGFEPPPKSTGILRLWRKENRAGWVKGGGFRTSLRLTCCCFLSFIFILLGVVLTLAMWIRPPNISLNAVDLSSNSVALTTSGLTIAFSLNISATNPNWFSAKFAEISAVARYPGNNTNVFGGGSLSNIDFKSNSFTTFEFPFTLNYTTALDPDHTILADMITKCTADPVQDITVDYDLTLKLKVASFSISPTLSSSATFVCPVDASDLEGLLTSGS